MQHVQPLLYAEELLSDTWRAETNCADVEGWTPLMEAAFRGNEAMAAALLVGAGLQAETRLTHELERRLLSKG